MRERGGGGRGGEREIGCKDAHRVREQELFQRAFIRMRSVWMQATRGTQGVVPPA